MQSARCTTTWLLFTALRLGSSSGRARWPGPEGKTDSHCTQCRQGPKGRGASRLRPHASACTTARAPNSERPGPAPSESFSLPRVADADPRCKVLPNLNEPAAVLAQAAAAVPKLGKGVIGRVPGCVPFNQEHASVR